MLLYSYWRTQKYEGYESFLKDCVSSKRSWCQLRIQTWYVQVNPCLKKVIFNVSHTVGEDGGEDKGDGKGEDSRDSVVQVVKKKKEEESDKFHFYYFIKY